MSHNCELCNYKGKLKSNLLRHLKTSKHIKNVENVENKKEKFICDVCNNTYKHRQSLYNHQMICKNKNTQCIEYNKNNEYNSILETIQKVFGISNDKNVIIENPILECMLKKIVKDAIQEVLPTIVTNSNINNSNNIINSTIDSNNTINIQVFLNEHCKDAMTIQHFTKNISMDIDEIVNKRKEKYFKGVSNIVLENLKPLSITQRPIHCTDVKNSKWMINDAKSGWMEDNGHKIVKQTESVLNLRFNVLWREKYPDCENSDSKKDKWVETIYFLTKDIPDIEIIRTLKKMGPQCELKQSNMKEIMSSNTNVLVGQVF
jgi:hypothetical protein